MSRSVEESTSAVRQKEVIQQWCDLNGHEVVGWAEDLDVSGSVDPFEAPELSKWLQPEKLPEWQIMCAWKLDRVARRTIPMHKLFGFLQDEQKTLVCVSDNIDLSTLAGRMVATVIAYVAEGELEAIRDRTSASYSKLKAVGRWPGGTPPYGFTPEPVPGGGWTLRVNPQQAAILHRIIDDFLDGKAAKQIAEELTIEGVDAPGSNRAGLSGVAWSGRSIRRMLASKTLIGHSVFKGESMRDSEGQIVEASPALITRSRFAEVQSRLRETATEPKKKRGLSPLSGIVMCWDCGKPRYQGMNAKPYNTRYYNCPTKGCLAVRAEPLEESVYHIFLGRLGDFEQVVKHVSRPVDNSDQIEEVTDAAETLVESMGKVSNPVVVESLRKQLVQLDAELTRLQNEHTTDVSVSWTSTGVLWRDIFESADADGKREIMLKAGITVEAKPMHTHFHVPEDLLERLK